MQELEFHVTTSVPVSLRSYLRGQAGVSARLLSRLKRQQDGILCNGKPIRVIDPVRQGDVLLLRLTDSTMLEPNVTLAVPVCYESDALVVYDKPAGMPVHPSVHHRTDTLGNCFAARYPALTFRPLNRLDRDTSGLCAVAKTAYAANALRDCLAKRYYAVVSAGLTGDGIINAPIAREQDSIIRRCVRQDGRQAVTHYHVLGGNAQYALLELRLETGRTHQIRVHCASIGYPLIGDGLYGGDCTLLQAQALHCGQLSFPDCMTGEQVRLTSPCRPEMLALVPEVQLSYL